jgi:hypothetical protein
MQGRPFHYFAYGAAVSEVLPWTPSPVNTGCCAPTCCTTWATRINPAIDIGQIEGGYVQGLGWLTSEELVWHPQTGALLTHAPSTYKIPTANDARRLPRPAVRQRQPGRHHAPQQGGGRAAAAAGLQRFPGPARRHRRHRPGWLCADPARPGHAGGGAGCPAGLGPTLGQCCGGVVTLRFEVLSAATLAAWQVPPPRFHVELHGAGHVGQAIVKLLSDLDCSVRWIDERADDLPEWDAQAGLPDPAMLAALPEHITWLPTEAAEREVADAPADACHLVLTHRHDLDLKIIDAVLRRDDFRFAG